MKSVVMVPHYNHKTKGNVALEKKTAYSRGDYCQLNRWSLAQKILNPSTCFVWFY